MSGDTTRRAGLGQAFRVPEFRALWAAEVVSVAGDQLARVGLTVLVYDRTSSAAWAAASYALTFLPALLGGVLLGRLADRHPRREVMVACDAVRAVLVAVMALPGLPIGVVCALLVGVVLLAPPHSAAQGGLLPDVLTGRAFEAGLAVRQITGQAAQVGGFALGGVLVAALAPGTALALNAASFALSALVLRLGVRARPAPAQRRAGVSASLWLADVRDGLRAVFGDPQRRTLAGVVWLVGCFVLPEALAVPYAAALGAGPAVAGALMAADPTGSVVGAWLFTRFVPERLREPLIGPLAVGAALPLALCAVGPGVVGSFLLFALSGACATACLVQAQAGFVRATPPQLRGRAIGVAASGLIGVQGLAVLAGGVVAEAAGTPVALAGCGAIGLCAGVGLAVAHRRARGSWRRPATADAVRVGA